MLYVARAGAGDITAICNNPTTAENLRALIDDSIEEVPAVGAAEDYVFTIDGKAGSQHIATSEAAVVDFITSTPGIQFKKDSPFYSLPQDEAKVEIQNWLDDGHMANELTEDLEGTLVSEYRVNTIYSKAAPMLEGRDIDVAFKEILKLVDKDGHMDFTKLEGKSDIERTYFFRAAEALTRNDNAYSPDNAMSTDKGIADAMIAKGYDIENIYP